MLQEGNTRPTEANLLIRTFSNYMYKPDLDTISTNGVCALSCPTFCHPSLVWECPPDLQDY